MANICLEYKDNIKIDLTRMLGEPAAEYLYKNYLLDSQATIERLGNTFGGMDLEGATIYKVE